MQRADQFIELIAQGGVFAHTRRVTDGHGNIFHLMAVLAVPAVAASINDGMLSMTMDRLAIWSCCKARSSCKPLNLRAQFRGIDQRIIHRQSRVKGQPSFGRIWLQCFRRACVWFWRRAEAGQRAVRRGQKGIRRGGGRRRMVLSGNKSPRRGRGLRGLGRVRAAWRADRKDRREWSPTL